MIELNDEVLTLCIAIIHIIVFMLGIGYAQNYYFHLRKLGRPVAGILLMLAAGHHKNNAH